MISDEHKEEEEEKELGAAGQNNSQYHSPEGGEYQQLVPF